MLISCRVSDKDAKEFATSRPDTLKTELMVEGMPESMNMYLLESPENFPIHFSTYIPVEMIIDTASFETGKAIHIIAAFGGRINKDARLTIFAFSPEINEEEARKITRQAGGNPVDSTGFSWAEAVYNLGEGRSGFLALGENEGQWFYLLATYPPVYADGMGPRIAMILDQWRWAENGKSLQRKATRE